MPRRKQAALEWEDFKVEKIKNFVTSMGFDIDSENMDKMELIEWLKFKAVSPESCMENSVQGRKLGQEVVQVEEGQRRPHQEKLELEGMREGEFLEDFLLRFEGLVQLTGKPERKWTELIYGKLRPEGQRVVQGLEASEQREYKEVKRALLQFYKVTPEHFRKRFQTTRKEKGSTYVELSRTLKRCFIGWMEVTQEELAGSSALERCVLKSVLNQLVKSMPVGLEVQFRQACTTREEKQSKLEDLGQLADELVENWKQTRLPKKGNDGKLENTSERGMREKEEPRRKQQWERKFEMRCFSCGEQGHIRQNCPVNQGNGQ